MHVYIWRQLSRMVSLYPRSPFKDLLLVVFLVVQVFLSIRLINSPAL